MYRTAQWAMLLLCPGVCLLTFAAEAGAQNFVVNEVQPAPAAGEPEWVELYNRENRTRILRGGFISDSRSTTILPEIRIPARGYALLSRDTAALRESRRIPASATLVEVRLPSLNNSSDMVVLHDADSVLVDSLYYSLSWGRRGISLERLLPEEPAHSAANMQASRSRDSASAGYVNSIVLLDTDAMAYSITAASGSMLEMLIRNNGRNELGTLQAALYYDSNGNGVPEVQEKLTDAMMSGLDSAGSYVLRASSAALPPGYLACIGTVYHPADERPYNDTLHRPVYKSHTERNVRINEFMFRPLADSAEFVEVWNASDDTVHLFGWKLHDQATASGADTIVINDPDARIAPRAYMAITWDSAFYAQFTELRGAPNALCFEESFNLNADEDEIVLRDPNGIMVDSLRYRATWHILAVNAAIGRSLEKINPELESVRADSWTTSGAQRGGSPAAANSVSQDLPEGGNFNAAPNPFSVTGLSGSEVCFIRWKLPFRQAHLSLSLFDTAGRSLRTLLNAVFSASEGHYGWNGTDSRGHVLPPGPYICLLEASDIESSEIHNAKLLIVIKK